MKRDVGLYSGLARHPEDDLTRHPEDGLTRHPEARSAERIALNPRQFQLRGRDSDPFVAARLRMTSGESTQDTPGSLRFLRSRAGSPLLHQDAQLLATRGA